MSECECVCVHVCAYTWAFIHPAGGRGSWVCSRRNLLVDVSPESLVWLFHLLLPVSLSGFLLFSLLPFPSLLFLVLLLYSIIVAVMWLSAVLGAERPGRTSHCSCWFCLLAAGWQ